MTSYIQKILFEPFDFGKLNPFPDLYNFMFTKKFRNEHKIIKNVITDTVMVEIKNAVHIEERNKESEFILPKQENTLFWCVYICKNGNEEYKQIKNNYGTKQLEIQEKVSKHLKENIYLFKNTNTRITKACSQEIMSDLLINFKKTGIYTLYGLILYFNFNIILLDKSETFFLELKVHDVDNKNPYYLIRKEDNLYKVKEDCLSEEEYKKIIDEKISLYSYDKPLKPISNYKVDELHEIANKVDSNIISSKINKTELYNELKKKLSWN